MDDASSSAQKLKKSLASLPFDQLNQLTGNMDDLSLGLSKNDKNPIIIKVRQCILYLVSQSPDFLSETVPFFIKAAPQTTDDIGTFACFQYAVSLLMSGKAV